MSEQHVNYVVSDQSESKVGDPEGATLGHRHFGPTTGDADQRAQRREFNGRHSDEPRLRFCAMDEEGTASLVRVIVSPVCMMG